MRFASSSLRVKCINKAFLLLLCEGFQVKHSRTVTLYSPKPLLCALTPMRTAGPTARSFLAILQVADKTIDMSFARFRFFDDDHPADPLVARERRQTVPNLEQIGIRNKGLLEVCRNLVDDALGDQWFVHMQGKMRIQG